MVSYRTPLSRARGLGAAKHGAGHWISERVSSIALVPLTLWAAYGVIRLAAGDYGFAVTWIADPLNATLLVLTLAIAFWHMHSGMRVVVELRRVRQAREHRAEAMIELLRKDGIDVTWDEVRESAAGGTVGRPHVAQALIRRGLVDTVSEAFAPAWLGYYVWNRRGAGAFLLGFVLTAGLIFGGVLWRTQTRADESCLRHGSPFCCAAPAKVNR